MSDKDKLNILLPYAFMASIAPMPSVTEPSSYLMTVSCGSSILQQFESMLQDNHKKYYRITLGVSTLVFSSIKLYNFVNNYMPFIKRKTLDTLDILGGFLPDSTCSYLTTRMSSYSNVQIDIQLSNLLVYPINSIDNLDNLVPLRMNQNQLNTIKENFNQNNYKALIIYSNNNAVYCCYLSNFLPTTITNDEILTVDLTGIWIN